MNDRRLDELVLSLAVVTDDALSDAPASPQAERLLRAIVHAQPAKRRLRLLVAAVAAAALVAAPALALRGPVVRLFARGGDAPARVAKSFDELEGGAPAEWRISGTAKLVLQQRTPDGLVRVWAAPRTTGFCYAVGTAGREGFASTCTDRSTSLDVEPFTVERPQEAVGGPFVLVGYSLKSDATSVRVRFDSGEEQTLPLTWISSPIDAGFFVVWTSKGRWRDGHERFEVTALNDAGKDIEVAALEVGAPTP